MKSIKKLLVVIDPDVEIDFVVERAKIIASKYQASVLLFMNQPNALTPDQFAALSFTSRFFKTQEKLFVEHFEERLSKIREEFTELGLTAECQFSSEKQTSEAILDKIRSYQPDMAMKSVQKHSALKRILITNTDWRLIKNCKSPLLLVKSQQWQPDGCVMAAVDPFHAKAQQNALDHLLLDTARTLAASLELKVRVFHSYFPDLSTMFPKALDAEDYIQEIKQLHRAKIEELLRFHDIGSDAVIMSRGDLIAKLFKCIRKEKANILILGALSRNFVEQAIVGSTAEKILYDTPCDILVMKNPPDSAG